MGGYAWSVCAMHKSFKLSQEYPVKVQKPTRLNEIFERSVKIYTVTTHNNNSHKMLDIKINNTNHRKMIL